MTILGIVTIAAVGATWLFRRGWLQYVFAVTAVFPQSAGLLIGDKGFPLFYLAIAVAAVLSVPKLLMLVAAARATDGSARVGHGSAAVRGAHAGPSRTPTDLIAVGLVIWGAVIS